MIFCWSKSKLLQLLSRKRNCYQALVTWPYLQNNLSREIKFCWWWHGRKLWYHNLSWKYNCFKWVCSNYFADIVKIAFMLNKTTFWNRNFTYQNAIFTFIFTNNLWYNKNYILEVKNIDIDKAQEVYLLWFT